MSDAVDRGFTVTELAPVDNPIETLRETTAAFVGRALRGPLNQPVLVRDYGDFRRRFGDIWTRSSLAPAVKAFFQHGGRELYVVRVANGARGAMLCLPAAGSALVLRAVEPGSTECLRAAVDYDGIDEADDVSFNLTLQRIEPDTELVLDQEIHRRVSIIPDTKRFVGDHLLSSTLARLESPLPRHRPDSSYDSSNAPAVNYVTAAQRGTDGTELTDYDLVGSKSRQTGLFSLDLVERIDLIYLPPPGKHHELGPASILAAEQYARLRNAMVITDPPVDWNSARNAITASSSGIASPNVLTYFPRLRHRYDKDAQPRAAGGAIAGLLCKLDRRYGAWNSLDTRALALSRDWVPVMTLDEHDAALLHRAGINSIEPVSAGVAVVRGSATLERGQQSRRSFSDLAVRRFCLQVIKTIDESTRQSVFERADAGLATRLIARVNHYLESLAELGALDSDSILVDCDAGLRGEADGQPGFALHIAFRPTGSDETLAITLHQAPGGCRVTATAFPPASARNMQP